MKLHNQLKTFLKNNMKYVYFCDGTKIPSLNTEEFNEFHKKLCVEVESLLRKSFQLGHMIAGSDLAEVQKKDFDGSLDKHYSEIKWQACKEVL